MTRLAKHRHSVDGGYPRGEETRARIIEAAMALFGERGYEGASTRDIAARAGVNAPALQYYFDSKEGVYLACAEQIVSHVWDHLSDVIGRAEHTALAADSDDGALIDAFCEIQAKVADMVFTAHIADSNWRLFMAREQAGLGPAAGFQIVFQQVNRRMYGVTGALVGRLLGKPSNDEEVLIRIMALNGQQMYFQHLHRTALGLLDWDVISPNRLALLKRVIREQTATVLRALAPARRTD
jgi:AcrR family transcriptional regulator